jgi:hypothetical protein
MTLLSHTLISFLLLSTAIALPERSWPWPARGGLIGHGSMFLTRPPQEKPILETNKSKGQKPSDATAVDSKKAPEPKKSPEPQKSPEPKKPADQKKSDKKQNPNQRKPLTVTTEKSADCNEFPDPGYGGSDPDTYRFWPGASRIGVTCYTENFINGFNYTYLKTTSGCYIDEEHVQAGNKDFTALLPKCALPKPYQVYTTKSEYLLPKDGFWMECYDLPKRSAKKWEVQWGARHVACSVEGENINGDNTWWRDSHSLKGDEDRHCFVPDDAFDNMVYEIAGGGKKCNDFDRKA